MALRAKMFFINQIVPQECYDVKRVEKRADGILRDVLYLEAEALKNAAHKMRPEQAEKLTELFQKLIGEERGLCFCGVGKSGYVAKKLAATFASLGLSAYFLHPTEALHGDLGRLRDGDAIAFISKSGNTEEIIKLLPFLSTPKEKQIGLIGNPHSFLAKEVGIFLDCSVEKEACLNNQAPTTSSTVALGVGDAMAVLFESISGIDREGFAKNHPGGILGKSLRLQVKDIMLDRDQSPILAVGQTLKEAILEMTKFPVGGCAVLDPQKQFLGILVEGDIRRYFASGKTSLDMPLENLVNQNPTTVASQQKASRALELMEKREKPISLLPVIDEGVFKGFIRLHDLLKEFS